MRLCAIYGLAKRPLTILSLNMPLTLEPTVLLTTARETVNYAA